MIKRLFGKYKQIILYLLFGVITTGVNWCIYGLFCDVLQLDMTVSNSAAWLGAALYAFVTNKLFVFQSKSLSAKLLLKEGAVFFAARVFSGVFEIFLPTVLFHIGLHQPLLGLEGGTAKALVSILIVIMNYVFSKFIVFRKK